MDDRRKSRPTNQRLMSETSPIAASRITIARNPMESISQNLLNQFNSAEDTSMDISMNISGNNNNDEIQSNAAPSISGIRHIPQCIRPNVKDFIDCSNIGRNTQHKRERTNKVRNKLNNR